MFRLLTIATVATMAVAQQLKEISAEKAIKAQHAEIKKQLGPKCTMSVLHTAGFAAMEKG